MRICFGLAASGSLPYHTVELLGADLTRLWNPDVHVAARCWRLVYGARMADRVCLKLHRLLSMDFHQLHQAMRQDVAAQQGPWLCMDTFAMFYLASGSPE